MVEGLNVVTNQRRPKQRGEISQGVRIRRRTVDDDVRLPHERPAPAESLSRGTPRCLP